MSTHPIVRALAASAPALSFEFFPPADAKGNAALLRTASELGRFDPSFMSVTYGAGGSTRHRTQNVVAHLNAALPMPVMPHLTCIGHSRAEVDGLLDDYAAVGIETLLALAGDPPADGSAASGDFRYASELVEVARERQEFAVGVAAFPEVHPRSKSRADDRANLARKLELADFAITQFFFDASHYIRLVDELGELGCTKPVIPGVLPLTNPKSARRFAKMNGAEVPEELFSRLESASESERLELAVEHAAALTTTLLEAGAPGVHFYTLNQAEPTRRVVRSCGLAELVAQ